MEGGSDEAQQSLTVGHLWADLCWVTVGCFLTGGSGSVVKNLVANAGGAGDVGCSPGSGKSLAEGTGNPLQYSCLGNLIDREARWATVHGVKESDTT